MGWYVEQLDPYDSRLIYASGPFKTQKAGWTAVQKAGIQSVRFITAVVRHNPGRPDVRGGDHRSPAAKRQTAAADDAAFRARAERTLRRRE